MTRRRAAKPQPRQYPANAPAPFAPYPERRKPATNAAPQHTATADCWCEPQETLPGVWLHRSLQ